MLNIGSKTFFNDSTNIFFFYHEVDFSIIFIFENRESVEQGMK